MVAALQATRVTSSHGRKQAQCGGCASFAQSLAGSNQSMIVTVRIRSAETRRSTRVGHKALERTSRIFQGHENVLAVLTRALEQKRLVARESPLRQSTAPATTFTTSLLHTRITSALRFL
ncbi:hypothetical protein HBH59_090350 [Parastagonospora nodorum]|nr:hypothetical protein HBH93_077230 [Parastagonospora nodorum]KAH4453658.1 hypothetical protein HBH91_105460 [Parastagonospora nodorum]KAH4548190.1 hypothetical protein HBH85_063270 [Parastagonospora nodorum]KAH4876086.1 hypothetical protein HBH59_090350 [Parastagonospora nodorum]KAH4883462.1 hypothetical protein HBH58_061380 [Parastagonospora nodorum]